MESSSKFRFRDHHEMENYVDCGSSSEISSAYSDPETELEIESMTGKGIKHLCSELLELKAASDEDFHKNIYSNYPAFVRIFSEVKGIEDELMQLKAQLLTQQNLVKILTDGTYLKAISTKGIESIVEESESEELASKSEIKAHIDEVSETLDMLLFENRIDEAIDMLEIEDENFRRIQSENNSSSEILMLYNLEISDKKEMVKQQLTLIAENKRVTAPELQMALVGLCRLGENPLATELLLKYYRSRIETGMQQHQCSKSVLHGLYIKELAKFVFSMISQAAKSFVMLYGESSPYDPEFIQWALKETEVFGLSFNNYVKSIAETSGGLTIAIEAVQFTLPYCSLLKAQRLVLWPCLIKQIRPCMEEALQIHLDHIKKDIETFTTTDAWVLGRYLVSGSLIGGCSSVVAGQRPEYCLLTDSGRKFVTLLQDIAEQVTPLVGLQMEGCILRVLVNLFKEYVKILERAITSETDFTDKGGPRINVARSLEQQISVLANLSTLEQLFSYNVQSIFKAKSHSLTELMKKQSNVSQQKELGSMQFIIEASGQLRAHFFQQFIHQTMSIEMDSSLIHVTIDHDMGDSSMIHNVMPSATFQVLFLELRKFDKLAENNIFELDWLMELSRDLVEAIFFWISNNISFWATTTETSMEQKSDRFNQAQFVVDVHFLVEIALLGGYFNNSHLILLDLIKSAFNSAGLDPNRDAIDDEWVEVVATKVIQSLLDIEKANLLANESFNHSEKETLNNQSETPESIHDEDRTSLEDSLTVKEDQTAIIDASEGVNIAEKVISNAEGHHSDEESLELLVKESPVERMAAIFPDDSEELKESRSNSVAAKTEPIEFVEDVIKDIKSCSRVLQPRCSSIP